MTRFKKTWHHCSLLVALALIVLAISCTSPPNNKNTDPSKIVKKHFVFYPNYSHGIWQEQAGKLCPDTFETSSSRYDCVQVRYTINIQACGPVTFAWRVDPTGNTFYYQGPKPRIKETEYPLYAFLDEDSGTLVQSPALGKPLPETCQFE